MAMFSSLRWIVLKQWWKSLLDQEEASSSSQPLTQTRLESLPLSYQQGLQQSEAYPSSLVDNLYWISFRDHDGGFLGVVITRGDSPGKAASKAIDQLELPTNRA